MAQSPKSSSKRHVISVQIAEFFQLDDTDERYFVLLLDRPVLQKKGAFMVLGVFI